MEPVCFSEGLAAVLSDDGDNMWYIDITGKRILGPYEALPAPRYDVPEGSSAPQHTQEFAFHEGYAPFYQNGKYGVIDKNGTVIISAVYDGVVNLGNGMVRYDADGMNGVVTVYGVDIAKPIDRGYYYSIGQRLFLHRYGSDDIEILPDGTTRPYNKYKIEINGKTVAFPDSTYDAPSVTPLPNGKYLVIYFEDSYYMSIRWRIYDENAEPSSVEVQGYVDHSGFNGIGLIVAYSWPNPRSGSGGGYSIYDLDGNLLLPDTFSSCTSIGEYLMVRTAHYSGVIDAQGNYIIKAPLLRALPD